MTNERTTRTIDDAMTTMRTVTKDELRQWMATNGYTIEALTLALRMPKSSMRTVQRWRDGSARIPPYLELALQALTSTPQTDEHPPEPIEEVERQPFIE